MTINGLFADPSRYAPISDASKRRQELTRSQAPTVGMEFGPDQSLTDIYERALDPENPFELRDLYLGRVEEAVGARSTRPDLAAAWRASKPRRIVDAEQILRSRATVRFVKETFNHYFRDDLYGALYRDDHLLLSTGSVDEEHWGLPATIKDCIDFALGQDWYGYSDSRGRESSREAVAAYESMRVHGAGYTMDNVALTLGGTFAVSSLADFVLTGHRSSAPALCGIPNYPPLLESIARRGPVSLVPTPLVDGTTSIRPVLEQLRPDTPLVLLQTVTNPTGAPLAEEELASLIRAANPATIILLDECHEWLGPQPKLSSARAADNVVRISSLSKNWSAPGMKIGWILAGERFVDEYYEYASSNFGGPPSFFYTAVEVLARMERWRNEGVSDISPHHLAEFESGYGLTLATLQSAYSSYTAERDGREATLIGMRDIATQRLVLPNTEVAVARYSINTALALSDYDDSYLAFRDLLDHEGVSVFPGLLTFCLSGGVVRVTTSRRWSELDTGLNRLRAFLDRQRNQGFANGTMLRA
ncbi:pyridoxal phosphate-dependent aminotransferase [Nocardia sp. NPDC058114]|uniref:pyridoxal phosphate-dependent aminotransferase n=1 Tax=Nocardia sp. NPDC058114 TaxID=3346346 RepID=UPI0036DA99C0